MMTLPALGELVTSLPPPPLQPPEWSLCLYVLGRSPQSQAALRNLKQLCETHLSGNYEIEVIDLQMTPGLSRDHQIFAIPTLVRKLPAPIRKIIGDLSDTERTLIGLDLSAAPQANNLLS
jgi:circadian clock protein KaiB